MVARFRPALMASLAAVSVLAACGGDVNPSQPDRPNDPRTQDETQQGLFGKGGGIDFGSLLGGGGTNSTPGQPGLGVNAYLWRASLDTIAFMPIASADPFGGVIITDWYSTPESPNERFKLNVFIVDRVLRADAVRVTVFRQTQNGGQWFDAPVDVKTGPSVENSILTRARQLRIASSPAAP